ncbi:MAG: LuxR C-terminal-related transcriptional regulator [Dehalococcoidia bacterium]
MLGTGKLVQYCILAGEQAIAAHAHEEALNHLQRALAAKEGQPPDEDTADLLFRIGRVQAALLQTGDAQASLTKAFDYYVETKDGPRAVAVAGWPVGAGDTGVSQLVAQALELVPPDSLEAGRLLSSQGFNLYRETGDYEGAQELLDRALSIAQREEDVALEMWTLARAGHMGLGSLRWDVCLEKNGQAIELNKLIDDPVADTWCRYCVASTHISQGESKEAQTHVDAMLASAERVRYRRSLVDALMQCAKLSSLEGEWQPARHFIDRGLAEAGQGGRLPRLLAVRALLEYELGNIDEGEAYLERLLEVMQSPQSSAGEFRFVAPVMVIPLASRITGVAGRFDIVERAAQTVLASPAVGNLTALETNTGLGLLAVQRNDLAAAEELYRSLESHRGRVHLPVPNCISIDRLLGLLSTSLSRLDLAVEHFQRGLSFTSGAGYRPEQAWTCCDYADTLLQRNNRGDREQAMSLLDESLSISTELEMRPLTERVQSRLEGIEWSASAAPAYPDGLTQREVEVLNLVAQGKSNREIGVELVISESTARRHVSNIYDKIGVSNRAEATRYALEQQLLSRG